MFVYVGEFNATEYVPFVFVTFNCAPVPALPLNVGATPVAVPVPVNAEPLADTVKISPPVSTLSTRTVQSLSGVEPPKSVPDTTIASPTV